MGIVLSIFPKGLGDLPFGESPVRLLPADFYRLDKIRLRQIPAGHCSFAFIAVETYSGEIFRLCMYINTVCISSCTLTYNQPEITTFICNSLAICSAVFSVSGAFRFV